MIGIDYVGLGALVSAIGAALVSIIVALRQTKATRALSDVHAAVSTSTEQTLGQVVETIAKVTNGTPQ